MQDYVKPSLSENPHHLIIYHSRCIYQQINDRRKLQNQLFNQFYQKKSNSCDVTLSDITVRNDGHQQKVVETNRHLKELRKEKNVFLIQRDKTIITRGLNGSKLHINKMGTKIILNTLIGSISNIIHWQQILHSPDDCLIDEYNTNLSSKEKLSILRKRNINNVIVAHRNINSLRNFNKA